MAEREYRLVFRGETGPGIPVEAVKANLAVLFGVGRDRIAGLFSGGPVVLKKGLSREAAERYRLRLREAGALCEIVPEIETSPTPAADPPVGTGAKLPRPRGNGKATGSAPAILPMPVAHRSAAKAGSTGRPLPAGSPRMRVFSENAAEDTLVGRLKGAAARFRAGGQHDGPVNRRRWLRIGGAAAVTVVIAAVLMLGRDAPPLPIAPDIFDRFAKQYYREIRKTDLATADTRTLIERAREVVEDMGYDFDDTLLLWLLHKELAESRGGLDIYRTILVEPVAVAVAAGLSGTETLISPETRRIFTAVAAIPPGVELAAVRMIQACPSDGYRLRHDDLVRMLQVNDIPLDAEQPDLSIADTFFGLAQAGFIHIHRRWEKDVQFSDIEVLDPEALRRVEEQLVYLAEMRKALPQP